MKLVKGRVNYRNSSIHLKPSTDGLKHNIPPKSKAQLFHLRGEPSFQSQMKYPFWWAVWYEYGHIKDYHNTIKENPDQAKYLKDALNMIFQHLKILPFNPGRPADPKCFWLVEGDKIILLLNSSYIQLADRRLRFEGGTGEEQGGGSTGLGQKKSW